MEIIELTDIPAIMAWRREVIEHVFGRSPGEALMNANRLYYEKHIPEGSHLAVTAIDGEKGLGCGGVCFTDELPSPDNPSGRCAYLMNIYVREPFRNHGVAHEILRFLIKKARERDCGKIYLETTDEGRPVYTSLGFEEMEGMMKLKTH